MRFEWDEKKAKTNLQKHGIAFEAAMTAFDDPFALRAGDPRHSTATEQRNWLIGAADTAIVVVVFTERQGGSAIRLISARRASGKERRRYEESRRVPI